MSTVGKPQRPSRRKDPYFYGFRYLNLPGLDGTPHVVVQPLTEEDVLHPQEGDYITQGDPHDIDRTYLRDVATTRVGRLRGGLVLSDCLIDLGLPGIKPVGSDLAILRNVPRRKLWSSFDVRKEKAKWVLVGEITSPSTRSNDLNVKPDYYWRAGVPLLFIADQVSVRGGVRQMRLLGYERGRRDWRELPLSVDGRLWLEPLQLWLGVDGGRITCYDAEGREIADYTGLDEARNEAEAARLAAEEGQASAEVARAAAEAAQADTEVARAAEEAARRDAEERIRQLEEELRRLREGR